MNDQKGCNPVFLRSVIPYLSMRAAVFQERLLTSVRELLLAMTKDQGAEKNGDRNDEWFHK